VPIACAPSAKSMVINFCTKLRGNVTVFLELSARRRPASGSGCQLPAQAVYGGRAEFVCATSIGWPAESNGPPRALARPSLALAVLAAFWPAFVQSDLTPIDMEVRWPARTQLQRLGRLWTATGEAFALRAETSAETAARKPTSNSANCRPAPPPLPSLPTTVCAGSTSFGRLVRLC